MATTTTKRTKPCRTNRWDRLVPEGQSPPDWGRRRPDFSTPACRELAAIGGTDAGRPGGGGRSAGKGDDYSGEPEIDVR